MGIDTGICLKHVGNTGCAAIDHRVMSAAFDIHSEMGRLLDEQIYKLELANRCRDMGFEVDLEVPITATFNGFRKDYFMDLVVDQSVVYELKATESLSDSHEAQLLNYLMLADGRRGKLVNFGAGSVDARFVNRTITEERRHTFKLHTENWCETEARSKWLRLTLVSLFQEWGVMLQTSLIRDAIIHFAGGADAIVKPVTIVSNDVALGTENMVLLQPDTMLVLTSLPHTNSYKKHLIRKLNHTNLSRRQWVNMNRRNIHLITLQRNDQMP